MFPTNINTSFGVAFNLNKRKPTKFNKKHSLEIGSLKFLFYVIIENFMV